ncbi:sugar phosphate isomerase/epimerase family protein [Chitinophaga japonensis]|uniref:Sugar phosphate isomerase/epimerase n=1 Tax=Chitinophaga japonensis TaxID=104662 RepID=A0A562SRY5_CHIJA|nr:sugar phosphate isomerase/epimerase family protein [Chitinophaga japonensis]TWI83972.1 sugar phosphate isomerase/epimerase [Chitinophaga japonensis]
MSIQTVTDLSRLCVHTITTRPWDIDTAVQQYAQAGVKGITVWRDALTGRDIRATGQMIRGQGLEIVSLCRGGFFPHTTAIGRQKAIDDNLLAIEEAALLGAPLVVLVCGADPAQPLEESRRQIYEGIAAVLPQAKAAGVKLAIEPMHPVYADTRSAINTLAQANDMAAAFNSPWLGVAVDVYHVWWDPALQEQIIRCGSNGHLLAFHICDWRVPTRHLLYDRGIMGEGCIPIRQIREWVESTGFTGFHEVEIFSDEYWAQDQHAFLQRIRDAYLAHG